MLLLITHLSSNYLSDAGFHDRVVIQELLKEVAQAQSLDTSHKEFKGMHAMYCTIHCCLCFL